MSENREDLVKALWQIYHRSERPVPWAQGGNLPWDEPSFSKRMLQEHLDESHGAASRPSTERRAQIDWLWTKLELQPEARVLDVTCGPGFYSVALAERGCQVTGIDFSPVSIAYARELAQQRGVSSQITFIEQDVRQAEFPSGSFNAALFLYGQLAVFPIHEAEAMLKKIARSLKPGGRLCVELLNQEQVDKGDSTWWHTADSGLWGDEPYLHVGERFWYEGKKLSAERFQIIHLDSGELTEVILCDQTYSVDAFSAMLKEAGFLDMIEYPAWDGLALKDAGEWMVYLAQKVQ